jgi:hypothetical protein
MERQRTVVEGVKIAVDEENAQAQYVFLQLQNVVTRISFLVLDKK